MESTDAAESRRGCGRIVFRSGLVALAIAAALGAWLYTGNPQQMLARYLLASQLGADVAVDAVALQNPLVVQGLTLSGAASSQYAPLLQVDAAKVAYDWRPQNPRHIREVALDGVRLSLRQQGSEKNFQFLLERFGGPGGESDVTSWIPERIAVDDLWLELDFPSYYLRMDNLHIASHLDSAQKGAVSVGSRETTAEWSSAYGPGGAQSETGSFTFDAAWDGPDVEIEAEMDLGALARVRAEASVLQRDGQPHVALFIPSAKLDDPLWSAMLTDLSPVPVRFETLTVEEANIHAHQQGEAVLVDQASADARLQNFAIGPPSAPYYEGPLQLAIRGSYGEETTILGTVTLRDGMAAEAEFQWTPEGLAGTVGWEPWPREALDSLIPAQYSSVLETLKPLDRLGARATIGRSGESVAISGMLRPAFGGNEPLEVPITARYESSGAGSLLSISSEVALNGGGVVTAVTVAEGAPPIAENTLTDVDVNQWADYLLGEPLVASFGAALSGTVDVAVPPDAPLDIGIAIAGTNVRYGDIVLPPEHPVTMNGVLTYDLESRRVAGKAVQLAQEGFLALTAPAWSLDLPTATLKTTADATLSLDTLAAIFEWAGLYGNAAIGGKLSVGPEQTRLDEFTASSEDLGYGDWSVPYGLALELAGSLGYVNDASTLALEPISAIIEGTRADAGRLAFHFPTEGAEFAVDASGFALESDLALLVRRGYLDAVTGGHASIAAESLRWSGGTLAGLATWDIAAEQLALADRMAVVENLAYRGRYNPGDEADGGGQLTATSLAVYDVPFGPVDTHLKVTADHLVVDSLTTTFLDGELTLEGTVDYLDPEFPGSLDVTVTQLDLARFTEVFEPPDVVLTGKVSGTADMVLSTAGLQDLNVNMTAGEGLTLNRSMVRQILMSQYVNDAVGSKRIQGVIEKVIGKDEQRPFKAAVLELRLEDGMIRGIARLESSSLDVTVDINAEPKAILEAIRSSQQAGP